MKLLLHIILRLVGTQMGGSEKGNLMRKILNILFFILIGLTALLMPTLILFGGF